ncbi:MAG: glycosyltransferase [Aliarcobacter sp.]|nr:glycosyltransferase [Aliarcobacter sp.]
MKTLIIGKKNMLLWPENLSEAFIQTNIENKILFLNELGFTEDLKRNIFKLVSKDLMYANISKIIDTEIKKFQPDLIIVISPFMFNEKVFECLDNFSNIIKCAWIGDRFTPLHKNIANKFDHLFYTDSFFLEDGKNFNFPNGSYLPLAVNENRFFDKNQKREERLLFIASYTKQRMEFLKQINSIYLKLIGAKWQKDYLKKHTEYVDKNININQVVEEYNSSQFILNIKHEHNVVNGLNMRTFESIASGGCLLQDYVKDIEINFEINKNILVYNNIEELNELILKMRKDKLTMNNLIKNGKELVLKEHTYKNRVNKILEQF